jgi:[acyl-carrier-protein] S-malonyltransferase
MGSELYERFSVARERFEEADALLGFSLSTLCFCGPEDRLHDDLNAQLAVYTLSAIITDILGTEKVFPHVVSGYSSGFYAAAYAAGCYTFNDGLHLVRRAGEILLEQGRDVQGGMAVIFGLPKEKVAGICRRVGNVDVAIQNTPRQIIVSGLGDSVKKVTALALEEDALDVYPLPVATAYHSRFMKVCSERFLEEMDDRALSRARIPLVSYSSLESVVGKESLKEALANQLSRPVRWVEVIGHFRRLGIDLFMEVGPGAVLSRAVRWIDRRVSVIATDTPSALSKAVGEYQRRRNASSVPSL